jgi:flagellar hook-associated protein FlgK
MENSVNTQKNTVPTKVLDLMKGYKDAQKALLDKISQLESAICNRRMRFDKEMNELNQEMQKAVTQLNAVIGGIDALNSAVSALTEDK